MEFTHFTDYLLLEKNYSRHTLRAYTSDLKSFAKFVAQQYEEETIDKVNYSIIRSWIVHLINQGLSKRSVNRKISSLQAYYNFLRHTKQIATSPLVKHKSLKTAEKVQIPFSEKEMQMLDELPEADDFESARNQLIVELFYSTGIRRAELISIKINDMQLARHVLKIKGKGNKERLIPVLPSVCETLEKYLDYRQDLFKINEPEYLFLTEKGNKVYPMLVYRIVKDYFSKISTKTKISPHILRHTFATHLLNQGADINSIKSLLGHESLSSTQVYTHNDIAALRKVHAKAHPRNKNKRG